MLKLSILVGMLLPVADTVLNSAYSPIPATSRPDIQKYLSLVQEIQQNGIQNNRTTPFFSKIPTNPTIPIQT